MHSTAPGKLSRRKFMETGIGAVGGVLLSSCGGAFSNNSAGPGQDALVSKARIYTEGEHRIIESNGVPDHETGVFPSPTNPYAIGDREFRFAMPLAPQRSFLLYRDSSWGYL